jgi:HlyD family secretion protein
MTTKNNKLKIGMLYAVAIICITTFVLWGFITLQPEEELIEGQVEAPEIRISGKLAGRIAAFKYEEGQQVTKGDTLVWLNSPEVTAKLAQAKAAEDAASAQNKKAMKGARSEQITAAYEMWQKAIAGKEIAKKSFDRIQGLYVKGVVTEQKRDEAEANYKSMVSTELAAKAQYEMARNGAEQEDKMSAIALLNRAKGAVEEVESYQKESCLLAPIDAEVSEIYPKVGELVATGAPIMNLVDLSNCWVTFNVREELLNTMKMGSELKVKIPALANQVVTLRVTFIKDMGSYAVWKSTKVTGQYDAKTFEVRAKPTRKIDNLRPGMSAILMK